MKTTNNKPISEENANKYYDEIYKNHNLDITWGNKISMLQKLMEKKILKEVTKIDHFEGIYKNKKILTKHGQRNWLLENQINRHKDDDENHGFIPEKIVSGIIHLKKNRNFEEHEQDDTFYSEYSGNFTTVAQVINIFSGVEIPEEILDICKGKTVKNSKKTSNKKPKANTQNNWTGYYFVNTGISDDPVRNWEYNRKYKFVSGGNKRTHIQQIRKLRKGDKIFAYISRKGYVGYGIVKEEAVIVKEYKINGKKMIVELNLSKDHKWIKEIDPDKMEWIVEVNWKKTVKKEEDAKYCTGTTISYRNTVCKLNDNNTVDYLKREFKI